MGSRSQTPVDTNVKLLYLLCCGFLIPRDNLASSEKGGTGIKGVLASGSLALSSSYPAGGLVVLNIYSLGNGSR